MIVALAGLPGTGKSTLAGALALRCGGAVISKDSLRQAGFPAPWTNYTAAQDDFVMSLVLKATEFLVEQQRCPAVFLDGRTFSRIDQRKAVREAGSRLGRPVHIVECVCPDEIAIARIAADSSHPATNRNQALYWRIKGAFEPIEDSLLRVDTSRGLSDCVDACLRAFGLPGSVVLVPE